MKILRPVLKSNYSKIEFVELLKNVEKHLTQVDGELKFLDYDQTELGINSKLTTYQNFGIGYRQIEMDLDENFKNGRALLTEGNKQAMILTAWQNDEDYKLSAFQVLFSEGANERWAGSSACRTTKREIVIENGEKHQKTTILTDPLTH